MLKSHERFHSINGKRRILIAEDEQINREILGTILGDEYEILYAGDGGEALEVIRRNRTTLSLVLLDILMPVMSGLDVLSAMKEDETLSRIPVIVMTAERDAEVESLKRGAIDFIPKPYPAVDVILARVLRTIELSEDRDIIQSTERDELTGLYNREFFYRYAEQLDQFHQDQEMDAVLVDVNHFHLINERYGRAYGDQVLRGIGSQLQEEVRDAGGIVGRSEADTFMVYCPHREDYRELLERASLQLAGQDDAGGRVHLRMGVYSNSDKNLEAEQRFDRAKMAADTVKNSYTNNLGYYDTRLHEQQLYAEQLIEDFPAAIAQGQFQVYYQPKFDIRPDTPLLSSAEALVRWVHPTLGMISPGAFIPLFEDNGLIQRLDNYVWQQTARQIRDWKDRLGYSVPVSVNVSRIDLYDPALSDTLLEILRAYDLTGADFLLEITESAYSRDSQQIIQTVENLRSLGFQVEMDDFGTGYSSLNMISNLPIDALKLDMQFIRNAFREGGSTHMVEVIIGIARYLDVPTIAEGVETEEQFRALRALGCDLVQGYFFSKPVPAAEYEAFILQRKEADAVRAEKQLQAEKLLQAEEQLRTREGQFPESDSHAGEELARQLQLEQMLNQAGSVGKEKTMPEGKNKANTGFQLRTASFFFVVLALVVAAALMIADVSVTRGYQRMQRASDRYISAQLAASNLEAGSDYLSDRVRCFVVTGELSYLDDFFEEVQETRRRDLAVENLEALLDGQDAAALNSLTAALALSNELVTVEDHAMRLTVEADGIPLSLVPDEVAQYQLSPEDLAMSPEEMRSTAEQLVFDNNYMHYKDRIRENVNQCTQSLIWTSSQELEQASSRLSVLVNVQTMVTILFLLLVLSFVVVVTRMVRKPLSNMVQKMQAQETIPPTGVEELRFVTRTYNMILQENKAANEKLSHEASHDALTGLFNRGAYDLLMESADTEHMALMLIDVDYFKSVNDTYGHAVGDRVLRRVAEILRQSFRSVDILCRIGGDEFAVVMTRVDSSLSQLVLDKINQANETLQHPKDDLPPISLSVGVAFSDRKNPRGDIFKDADTALYWVKEAGRNGCRIYE